MNAEELSKGLRLAPEQLRWRCGTEDLAFETTADVEPLGGIIGQEDAIDALRFGLEIFAPGQNVYVRGLSGTGRMTLVSRLLEEIQPSCPLASDYCYVANFRNSAAPRLLTLPRSQGRRFQEAVDGLIEFLAGELAEAMNSEVLRARRALLISAFQERVRGIAGPFERELAENGLAMVSAKVGNGVRPMLLPLIDGQPAPPERIQELLASGALTEQRREELEASIQAFDKKLEDVAHELQRTQVAHATEARELFRSELRELLASQTRPIRAAFPQPEVGTFLDELVEDVVRRDVSELQEGKGAVRRYRVNVVLGHREDDPCPTVIETTPTLPNLLGSIDQRVLPDGGVVSDHLMITAGSLLRADGGYLVLEARDVLTEPGAWKVLVRTLRTGRLEIVPSEYGGPWGMRMQKPEAIPIKVKVILIGDPGLYHALDQQDLDFPHLFKVLADFDNSVPRGPESIRAYAGILARIAREENLPHFEPQAVAALAEHGARIAGRNDRLTTRIGRLVDIAREAAFLASKGSALAVSAEAVRSAVARTKRRADLPARKFRERIADGTIHIATKGSVIGQVNGLAVISAGPLRYGFPARITSTIAAGHAGMINIERESQLSGSIHTKGFYILGGLLRHLLQTRHPLAFSASLAFEQSYGGIDGDSASGAEMCCLLSALTDVPLRQDLAMTGAIDQHGRIQPIGAATEKIEGFYDACLDAGLSGTQGVLIPRSNVQDLMLRADVVAACARGEFSVYGVDTIHEALTLFTGVPAGRRDDSGEYPEGSLLRQAVDRAFDFWSLASARPVWESEEEEGEEADDEEATTPAEPLA